MAVQPAGKDSAPNGPPLDVETVMLVISLSNLYVKTGASDFRTLAELIKADGPGLWPNIKRYLHGAWLTIAADRPELEEISRADAQRILKAVDMGEKR